MPNITNYSVITTTEENGRKVISVRPGDLLAFVTLRYSPGTIVSIIPESDDYDGNGTPGYPAWHSPETLDPDVRVSFCPYGDCFDAYVRYGRDAVLHIGGFPALAEVLRDFAEDRIEYLDSIGKELDRHDGTTVIVDAKGNEIGFRGQDGVRHYSIARYS